MDTSDEHEPPPSTDHPGGGPRPEHPAPATGTLVQYLVDPHPVEGPAEWWVAVDGEGRRGGVGRAATPDVTVTTDPVTAREIASGRLPPGTAVLLGRAKVTGHLGAILDAGRLLGPETDPAPGPPDPGAGRAGTA